MLGLDFHDGFSPKGCRFSIDGPAITAAAGTQMLEIDYEAHLRNLTIVSGGAGTVGVGGYFTAGGHGALSSTYGLAADQVYEIEMVTPGGEIVTVNECQNTDLFWAMRGVSCWMLNFEFSNTHNRVVAQPSVSLHLLRLEHFPLPRSLARLDS
jgi:FAD/FMN-containing dehydrogenase